MVSRPWDEKLLERLGFANSPRIPRLPRPDSYHGPILPSVDSSLPKPYTSCRPWFPLGRLPMHLPPAIPRLLRRQAWTWRWLLNIDRTLPYRLFDRAKFASTDSDLHELRANGILNRPADHFFAGNAKEHLGAAAAMIESWLGEPEVRQF